MALTAKQESFCLAYLETGNASEAYRQCYDASKMTSESINRKAKELMDNGKIAARLKDLTHQATSNAVMTRQNAMEKLSLIASTNITDILEFDQREVQTEDGTVNETIWRMKDSEGVAITAATSIKSVTMTKFGPKIEMHDKLNAIKQLSEMLGWNSAKKFDLTSSDGSMSPTVDATKLSTETLQELLASKIDAT